MAKDMVKNYKLYNGFLIAFAIILIVISPAMAQKATVIMTFDDGWRSVSDKAFPIMQNNNQVGVAFVYIPPIIGGYPDFMQQENLNVLYAAGWDISSHTYSHTNLTTVNSTTLNYELSASLGWLNSNGYPRGAMILAYPEGAYNTVVIDAVKANHYAAARSVDPVNGSYPSYTLNSPDIFQMKAYETIGGTGTGIDNASTVLNQINNTIAVNGTLILVFHKIVDTLDSNVDNASTEFLTTDFQIVSDYLKSRSDVIDVTSLSTYLGTTPLPRYMPETPINISAKIGGGNGTGWINTSWVPGEFNNSLGNIGNKNKTDSYNVNVNGAWYNGTINTFINITVPYGGSTNVSVYAVNNTNGNSINPIPANLNTTIFTYIPPAPTNATYSYGKVGNGTGLINLKWENGTGGNITDYYNIEVFYNANGTWYNDIKNTSYNFSVIPGNYYEVHIFAVNSTNGISINQIPAIINVTIPLYIPPIPIEVGQWSNDLYAYFEWTNGSKGNTSEGNTTDFYNYSVNGIWTNLSKDTLVNVTINSTTMPNGIVNVSIYSYNSTNGGVINPIPLFMYMALQIDLRNIWAEYDIYAGDTLRINPIIYNPNNDTIRFKTNATLNATIDNQTGAFILNTKNGDQGIYNWNITAYDDKIQSYRTINFKVTITTKPIYGGNTGGNSGGNVNGGSTGGDGGGVSVYDPNAESYERRESQIRYNADSNVEFFKNNLVKNVTFHGIRNYGEVTVKVSILKGNPKPIYLNNTYKFFSISLDAIQQNAEYLYINRSIITIRVNKSNLTGNNIKAYRYVNDNWAGVEIDGTNIEDANTKEFKLKSNGLSNFVIVLEPIDIDNVQKNIQVNVEANNSLSISGNPSLDKAITKIIPESLWRKIINTIKKYMWWI